MITTYVLSNDKITFKNNTHENERQKGKRNQFFSSSSSANIVEKACKL